MSSTFGTISSYHGGDRAESAVLEAVPELRYVGESESRHWDAEVVELLSPSRALPFVGICLLEVGSVVEIKSAMVVLNDGVKGRFYVRRGQHERLLEEAGSYLFAVCEPTPERAVIALKIVPASLVDELIRDAWIEPDERAAYKQLAWSRIFDGEEVNA